MTGREAELQQRFGALSSEQVADLDRAAIDCGVTVMQLMEVAGWQVARCAWVQLREQPADVLVVAGRGNNGGDGLVAARHLATWGCAVRAHVLSDPDRVTGLVDEHLRSAQACGVEASVSEDVDELSTQLHSAAIVLDGLLGTGLSADPREPQASAIRALNATGMRVFSIDVPSGLDATTGRVPAACVRANLTCTLAAMKTGLWAPSARAVAGSIVVADIGMPRAAWERCGLTPPAGVRGGGLSPLPSVTSP